MPPSKRKKIMLLLLEGVSQDDIVKAQSCSKRTVSETAKAMKEHSITEEVLSRLTDSEVEAEFFPRRRQAESTYIEPDWNQVVHELSRRGVTRNLLWTEYTNTNTSKETKHYGYAAFCRKLEDRLRQSKATMKIEHVAGRCAFIDWAGDTMEVKDPVIGTARKAYLFVACLPYSDILYAEAFPDLKQDSWITGHIHAFEAFGGVPHILVPDQCATAVDRTPVYITKINDTYTEFAEHYHTAVVPARRRKPRDEALVEGGVNIVETWVAARLRNEVFLSFAELNEAISSCIADINARPFQVREGSRLTQFEGEGKPELKELPSSRFEISEWKRAKVSPDCHIQVDYMRYSVPAKLIGLSLDVRVTNSRITVFRDGREVADHDRLFGRKGQYSTSEAHMPEAHRRFANAWTPLYFQRWAASVGPATLSAINKVLESSTIIEQAFVPCSNILGLSKRGKRESLERACVQVDELGGVPSYSRIRNMMAAEKESALQKRAVATDPKPDDLGDTGRCRGASYCSRKAR
jgi:transposase